MRLRPQSFALFSVLVPGLLAVPVMTPTSEPAPEPVAPVVVELDVSGVDPAAAEQVGLPRNAVRQEGEPGTVVLTSPQGTRPFEMVGVTWDPDEEVGEVLVELRTRSNGQWSDWVSLDDEGSPVTEGAAEAPAVRPGTEPLWVGEADGVQARVDVLSGATPRGLRLSLIDPGESPADATAATTTVPYSTAHAQTSSLAPTVRSRAAWGADESIRKGNPSYASSTRAVTLHHSASSNSYSAADVPGILRGFYAYHVKSQGWSDLGYNFVVDRFGTVWEGRHGGTSRNVIGAHAGGFNTGTVGVSIIGTYESVAPSAAARESVARLAAWRMHLAGVNPKGTVALTSGGSTRYKSGTVVTLPTLFGHRDVSATACPGVQGQASLPGMRDRAAALIAGAPPIAPAPEPEPAPAPEPVAPPAVVAPTDVRVEAPGTAPAGSSVDVTVHGPAGQAVELWFARAGDDGATKRRNAVFGDDHTYRTSFTADAEYTLFAVSAGLASPRVTTRPAPATEPSAPAWTSPIAVRGPVTTEAGQTVPVIVTGPAGTAVSVWFRAGDDATFIRRRTGTIGADGTWTTSYVNEKPHQYFAMASTVTSNDATTLTGAVPNGLHITSPAKVTTGATVDLVVQGTAGAPVEVWFARRGEQSFNRRRTGVLGLDGTFRTSYAGIDDHTYFAVSGASTSTRRTTRVSSPPPMITAPDPELDVQAPASIGAGDDVELVVRGTAGAEVGVWFRRRGQVTWTRLRAGRFEANGTYRTSYAGTEDHEYFATSGSQSSADAGTTVTPVLSGPASVPLGAKVELAGRARPNDDVVVERRRRGTTAFERSTLKANGSGLFSTSYTADDEYEYRPVAASRIGGLRRTTVAPTGIGPSSVLRGASAALTGTARPGATVELWFRDEGGPAARSGSPLRRVAPPRYVLGRTLTADAKGAWTTSFVAATPHSWFAKSDGNATPVQLTTPQ